MVSRSQTITPEGFLAYAESHPETRFDFMDGELVEVSPKPLHARLQARLTIRLGNWLDKNPIGHIHTECLHVLNGENFIPDISINAHLADDEPYFDEPPLLAIEIRSDTQSRASQRRKAVSYIEHGTPAVLLLFPKEQIELFTAETGDTPLVFDIDDVIENIPGFSGLRLSVKDVIE
ncbi:MAG: Uma2 family endonuclease [Aggregatilineales bacterium]